MPHKESPTEFHPDRFPPFPNDPQQFPTVNLETISLHKLESNDPTEQERAFQAFKGRGFVYLELAGTDNGDTILRAADEVARAAEQTFALPLDEKLRFKPGNRELFGYKNVGATNADKAGTPDTAEFFNVSKNDMLAPDSEMRRAWPSVVMENKPLFAKYCRASHATGLLIMDLLADKLGVPREEIRQRHRIEDHAGDHIRFTRGPPRKSAEMPEIQTPSHTDFGTITILMNWLGGLQVWSTSSRHAGPLEPDVPGEWLWVKPQRGSAIVNLGDAAVKFTNGVLCSGRHRVVPSPGEQGKWPRYSIVYFVRPTDSSRLKTLKGSGIPAAEDQEEEGVEAKEWIYRQAMGLGSRHIDVT
ncbi:hypothetical protein LTR91_005778 [Friedmanniomyces endolithicus]|uniref:Fe2OG dioxygenase domain-containing protein n=1 Tax=Friedmanniomyces endolithicus TaxID=329885 RepID=A0AAN6QWR0_9PEZI|nr:hypothetical protein LTR35_011516 [Friedmanniomyces endolithicus]KAK0288379.1 hypothetical protein LTS00_009589 [Friedmanniomyces endolithicus]KAK0317898.1 hypothetical protein LTR82_011159 [Friedmanniomyces endolithicus]KAK0921360.1 hypothetical protein LTR57_008816 [Friedmanniomyces endolithicus]KAK1000334.1 hypothetical protein LTR91_005778 [Friedmanniomyces endolithicus]